MNDLELLDHFCDTCMDFIDPKILREITGRGLYNYINFLPANTEQAKAIVRARLSKDGKYFGDPQIDQVAGEIKRLEYLRGQLLEINITDSHKIIPVLKEMMERSEFILNYFKS